MKKMIDSKVKLFHILEKYSIKRNLLVYANSSQAIDF